MSLLQQTTLVTDRSISDARQMRPALGILSPALTKDAFWPIIWMKGSGLPKAVLNRDSKPLDLLKIRRKVESRKPANVRYPLQEPLLCNEVHEVMKG